MERTCRPWRTLVRLAGCLVVAGVLLLARPAAGDEAPYGVNIHAPEGIWVERLLGEAEAAGVTWVRVDFGWADVEREPGRDDWALYDAIVAEARRRGIRVLATLQTTPAWATDGPAGTGVPRDPSRWAAFCGRAAARYRGGIHAWGIWNEPNLSGFFAGSRQQYIDVLLKPAAAAIHAADPDAKVAAPDLAHLGSTEWYRWLHDVLSQAASSIDVVTHHVYDSDGTGKVNQKLDASTTFGGRPNLWGVVAPSVREVLEVAGQTQKPFWLTEVGWPSDDRGEAYQAAEVKAILETWFGTRPQPAWVKKVFVYELIDDGRAGFQKWGLLRPDLSRKPAFDSYRAAVAASPPYGDVATAGTLSLSPSVAAGASVGARVTVRNAGRTSWSREAGYHLVPFADAARFTSARLALPTGVPPGATATLDVPLLAPAAPGGYRLAFRLARDGGELFGPEVAQDVEVTGSCTPGPVPAFTAKPSFWVPAGATAAFAWSGGAPPFVAELSKGTGFGPSDVIATISRGVASLALAAPFAEAAYALRVASSGPCGDRGPFSDAAVFGVTTQVARIVPAGNGAASWLAAPGEEPPPVAVRFRNAGAGTAGVRFDVSGPFSVTPLSATVPPGEEAEVRVFAASGTTASPGVVLGRLSASWTGGEVSVPVTLAVSATRAAGVRPVADRDGVVFRAPRGADVLPTSLYLTNPAAVPVAFVPSVGPGGAWLSLDPADFATPVLPGESRRVRLAVDRTRRTAEDGTAPVRTVLAFTVAGGGEDDRLDVPVVDAEPGPLLPATDREPARESAPSFVVPTVTRATGFGGQRFRSSLVVRNTSSEPAVVDLFATPLGASGLDRALRVRRTIPPATTLAADDLLGTLFGRDDELTAHLEVRSASAASLSVRSVTYGEPPAGGSRFGAEVPVLASGSGTSTTLPPLLLTGLLAGDGYRTNLILAETTGAELRVALRLLDASARPLGTAELTVPAWGTVQSSLLSTFELPGSTVLASAALQVEPVAGEGRVAAIATVIDNASASFSVLTGRPAPAAPTGPDPVWVVPAIAHAPGLRGFFATDLFLTNASVRSAALTLTYTYSGFPQGGVATAGVVLGPKASLPFSKGMDAVVSLFGLPRSSSTSGTLRIEGVGAAALVARATVATPVQLGDPDKGTMAAEVAAGTAASPEAVGPGGSLLSSVAGLRHWPRERVNLLLAEAAGQPARVRVSVGLDGDGVVWEEELPVSPFEKRQLTDLLRFLGPVPLDRLTVTASPAGGGTGRVLATVTVIDNATGSSQVVPLVPPGPRPLP